MLLRAQNGGFTFNRDQVTCAKSICSAYDRTKNLGLHRGHLELSALADALETVSGQIGALRGWDLPPARVESLMKACAEFMSNRQSFSLDDKAMFGHFSLPAIEMVCQAWNRLLDPFWEQAKHEVRDSFASELVQTNITLFPVFWISSMTLEVRLMLFSRRCYACYGKRNKCHAAMRPRLAGEFRSSCSRRARPKTDRGFHIHKDVSEKSMTVVRTYFGFDVVECDTNQVFNAIFEFDAGRD